MKQTVKYLIFFILISITGLTGCVKNYSKERIIGKWKLERVQCYATGGYLKFSEPIDYSDKHIIYEFCKNNTLIVTSSISGNSQKKKYSYKCKRDPHPGDPFWLNIIVEIDKETYNGYMSTDLERISFSGSIKTKQKIDDADLDIAEQEDFQSWTKHFIKLN